MLKKSDFLFILVCILTGLFVILIFMEHSNQFQKSLRIVDKKLYESYRGKPCEVCQKQSGPAHHIKTRKTGGGDTPENLVALCLKHHNEAHAMGVKKFYWKYMLRFPLINRKQFERIIGRHG